MDLEFDSEEFLLQAFDEGFEETETSQEESQTQKIQPEDLPFVKCSKFEEFKNKIKNLQNCELSQELFGYENLPSEVIENFCLQNLMFLQANPGFQDREFQCLELQLCFARFVKPSESLKNTILRLNLCLGPLNLTAKFDLFHLNLMSKFLIFYNLEDFTEDKSNYFSDILTSICVMSNEKVKNSMNCDKIYKSSPFRCDCVKNLLLYMATKRPIMNLMVNIFNPGDKTSTVQGGTSPGCDHVQVHR